MFTYNIPLEQLPQKEHWKLLFKKQMNYSRGYQPYLFGRWNALEGLVKTKRVLKVLRVLKVF